MKARHRLTLLGLAGLVLGFALWPGGEERDARAEDVKPTVRVLEPERDVEELETPGVVTQAEQPETREVVRAEEGATAAAIDARPEDGEAAIDVEVVAKQTGEPLMGVRLLIVPKENRGGWRSSHVDRPVAHLHEVPGTDDLGRTCFLVPGNTSYKLSTMSPGVEPFKGEVTTPADGERLALRIELSTHSDWTFFGRVVDAETGEPLAGTSARFEDDRGRQASTDASGLFQLEIHPWELSLVRIEHAGYAWTVIVPSEDHATPEEAVTVRLRRSARIVARIERRDGALAGLEVRVHTAGFQMKQRGGKLTYSPIDDPVWRAEVGPSGVAVVEGLPPEAPLTVDVHESGQQIKRLRHLTLSIGEERELTIRIGSGCQILGEAYEADGTPAEGLEVWLRAALGSRRSSYFGAHEADKVTGRARVDVAGRFAFGDVGPGNWLVGPAAKDRPEPDDAAPVTQAVEIARDDVLKEVKLEIHRGLTIRGRVIGPDGENVSFARVADRLSGADCMVQDGNFTLAQLAPGEYELIVLSGGLGGSGGMGGLTAPAAVKARAGDQDVVIPMRQGGSLTLVVFGPDGESVTAQVKLIPEDPEAAGFSSTSISPDANGCYRFRGLAHGTYHVKASDSRGNVGTLRDLVVEADSELAEQAMTLLPGARVRVRITGREEGARLFARVLQNGLPADSPGSKAPFVVAPGPVTVELHAYDLEAKETTVLATREVTAVEGQEVEVVFDRTEKR